VRRNLELNLGKVCNNRCILCLDARAPRESRRWVPVERAAEELERGRADGADSLGLLGGEPTAHPSILEIVALATELGYARIAISTNAIKLSDRPFAEALVRAGVTRFSVSIHGHNPELEDRISGRDGNFVRKLAAIRNLVRLRQDGLLPDNVSLNPVLTAPLVGAVPELAAAFSRLGIRDVRYNFVRTDPCPELALELTPRLPDVTAEIARAVVVNTHHLHMDLSFGDLPLCAYPWEILSRRELARQVIGEARDLDTHVAVFVAPEDDRCEASRFRWSDRKRDALKIQPSDPCDRCRLRGACEGIWRSYVDTLGTVGLSPINHVPGWLSSS
jgi:MoaA/NifB/PqqE/SkfB family radical SAM enzyme